MLNSCRPAAGRLVYTEVTARSARLYHSHAGVINSSWPGQWQEVRHASFDRDLCDPGTQGDHGSQGGYLVSKMREWEGGTDVRNWMLGDMKMYRI